MKTLEIDRLDACWDGVIDRVSGLKKLDLSDETDLEQALEESQRLMGAIAHYRHLLMKVEPCSEDESQRMSLLSVSKDKSKISECCLRLSQNDASLPRFGVSN